MSDQDTKVPNAPGIWALKSGNIVEHVIVSDGPSGLTYRRRGGIVNFVVKADDDWHGRAIPETESAAASMVSDLVYAATKVISEFERAGSMSGGAENLRRALARQAGELVAELWIDG